MPHQRRPWTIGGRCGTGKCASRKEDWQRRAGCVYGGTVGRGLAIVGTGESSDHATHGSGYRKTLGAALFVDSRKPAAILSWRAAACRGGQGEGVLTRDVPDAHALWPVKLRRETGSKIRFTR